MTVNSIGFFTRVLDDVPAQERYCLAAAQIEKAEQLGFNTAWVAQHHFHGDEGGLPSPFPFLSYVAARTRRIRLGTGVVTLTMESPIRVAEDAVVTDMLANGRLEVGFGSGGSPRSYEGFGHDFADRHRLMNRNLSIVKAAWKGEALPGQNYLWPAGQGLELRSWQATFSTFGAQKAGEAGDGLMLSRTQPRPIGQANTCLADIQLPLVQAYLSSLPARSAPRIMASRSIFVADDRAQAYDLARIGLSRQVEKFRASGYTVDDTSVESLIRSFDVHLGTPEDVIRSLLADRTLDYATEVSMQVHSVDPPHAFILRSQELFATQVMPALGWAQTGGVTAR